MVAAYQKRKMLAELGYKFDGSKLSCIEADAYFFIQNQYIKAENAKIRQQANQNRARR